LNPPYEFVLVLPLWPENILYSSWMAGIAMVATPMANQI
jgi:hypothetical protein